MANIRIEMDRGMGWETRQEGEIEITADALASTMPAYAIQYPHRAFIDGTLIVEAQRPHGRRGNPVIVRHDAR